VRSPCLWRVAVGALAVAMVGVGVAGAQTAGDRAEDYRDVMLAQLALDEGDFAAAAARFENLAARDPANADWANSAIGARLASGDAEAALRTAEAAHAQGLPLAAQGRLVLAVEALRTRRWRDAAVWLRDFDGDANQRLAAGLIEAWAMVGDGDVNAGVAHLTALPGLRPFTSTAPFQRAMMREHDRDWGEAEDAYEEAGSGSRVFVENILRYGAFLERRGEAEAAAALYARWRARATHVALLAAAEGRYRAAAPSLQRSAALGLAGFGSGLADERAMSAAASMMSLALMLDPEQHGVRVALAGRLRETGQFAAAVAVLTPIGPGSVYYEVAQVEIIWMTAEQDRSADALAHARALAAETGGRFALRALADLSLQEGHWEQAEAAYSALLALSDAEGTPQWRPLYRRAVARDRQGRWADAERDLLAALVIAPNEAEILNHLGYGWIERGVRLEEALALVQRALRANPNAAHIIDSEGWGYYQLGRYEDAVAALERAQRLAPASAAITEHLGDALWRAGRRREARYQWRRAAGLAIDPVVRAMLEAKVETGLTDIP